MMTTREIWLQDEISEMLTALYDLQQRARNAKLFEVSSRLEIVVTMLGEKYNSFPV